MPAKNKVLNRINTLLLMRDIAGGGSSTLDGAVVAGATTIIVTDATNFAVGDTIRVGAGDELELAVIDDIASAPTLGLADPLSYDHADGEAVVEQNGYDFGEITDGGVSVGFTGQTQPVFAAGRRLRYTTLNGYTDLTAEWTDPHAAIPNLVSAVGAPLGGYSGAGTVADPFQYATDGSDFCTEANQSLIAIGTLIDGSTVRVELWGIDMDYTGVAAAFKRGELAGLKCKAIAAAGGVITTNASAYVANVSLRATKGEVFDALTEVGTFSDATGTHGASTLSANAAAAQKALTMTAVTNFAAGDWIRINSGDSIEYHRINSVVGSVINLCSKLLRAHAAGTAVVEQAQTPFAGVSPDGVAFSVGGSMDKIQIATKRLSVGVKPGAADLTVSFGVIDITLESFASGLGIATSAIVGGRLPLGESIGLTGIDGLYIKGLLGSGKTAYLNCWGCSQDLANVVAALASKGIPQIPITLRPTSGVQFLQHV